MNIHLLAEERYRIIRDRLAAEGRVLASELALRFGISEDTVRRDLRELARAGECRRVYGGAVVDAPVDRPLQERAGHAVEAKAALAVAAVSLLTPGQTIFLDAGTTNVAIARALPPDLRLSVATNSLGVATALAERADLTLIVLGGVFDARSGGCVGAETLHAIDGLSADWLFLGACGVDPVAGITGFDHAEAEVKRAMLRNSRALVVAATTDKLGTAAPFRVASPGAVAHLIVETDAPPGLLEEFSAGGCRVHTA